MYRVMYRPGTCITQATFLQAYEHMAAQRLYEGVTYDALRTTFSEKA